MYYSYYPPYLCHHGIKGQKWGLRRYQNPDGTLTEEGKKHYKRLEKLGFSKQENGKYGLNKDQKKRLFKTAIGVSIFGLAAATAYDYFVSNPEALDKVNLFLTETGLKSSNIKDYGKLLMKVKGPDNLNANELKIATKYMSTEEKHDLIEYYIQSGKWREFGRSNQYPGGGRQNFVT